MATTAFRSTTRRSSAEDSGSSNSAGSHRRSRSLSRYSGRFPPPPPPPEPDEFVTPRGRFVNKARGSGFPEISLDDLADEFFRARVESDEESEPATARSSRGRSGARYCMDTDSSRRRGRSVSLAPSDWGASQGKGISGSTSRRRRSVSTARHRCIDLENDTNSQSSNTRTGSRGFGNGKIQQQLSNKLSISSHLSRRSMSQKNLFHSHDNYSSHSSSVTDDERDLNASKCGVEKTIQTVYAPEKAEHPTRDCDDIEYCEVMHKKIRSAVDDIRMELEKVMVKAEPMSILIRDVEPKGASVVQAIAQLRRNYTAKLEQSEKRKQDLLAELAVVEERGQELSTIVKELLPSPKRSIDRERQSQSRRRSNDRTRICKRLTEEAERYFEDFLSNVEDTDVSSFDGERSDTGSTFKDKILHRFTKETDESMKTVDSEPLDTDGVLLPWLQWETTADASTSCKSKARGPAAQNTSAGFSNYCGARSLVNWSPGGNGSSSTVSRHKSGSNYEIGNQLGSSVVVKGGSSFDMEEYLKLQHSEDLLLETFRQRHRIRSGSMILCSRCSR